MAEVEFCNNNIGMNHPFSSLTMRAGSFLPPYLLRQDMNLKDREGNSPLHFAAASGDTNLIRLLLNAGASINDIRLDCSTPLHMAVKTGQEESVRILLDYKAKTNIKDLFGKTPLHSIAGLEYPDEDIMLKMAKDILDRGGEAKILMNESTDSGETALHCAIISDSEKLVKLLLQYGADVNAKNRDGKSPLYIAIELNNQKLAKLLIKHGARVNDKMNHGLTALHEAITQRSDLSVELLLSHGADVNPKDIYGKTPLHLAARLNYLDEGTMDEIVKLLLNRGADVNDFSNSGETAFHSAVLNGNERLVRLFLTHGADVNSKTYDGKSPLHFAVQYSNKNMVRLLLDRGAEIDERTNDGKLALHVAVAVEDENMIRILLERNADVNVIDKSGKTPLSLAFEVAHMRSIYNPWNGFNPIHSDVACDDNIFELLIKHIAKLPNVCDENMRMIRNDIKLSRFFDECQMELTKMKVNKICDNISMFRVLTKSINVVVGYSRNIDLAKVFESDLYLQEFPIYYQMIKDRYVKAEDRRQLLEPAEMNFNVLVEPFDLPDLVTGEILSYLTIEDLTNLRMT